MAGVERELATGHHGRLIVGGSLAFVIGATVMILLHETSHALTGAVLGFHPRQLPFAVDYTPVPAAAPHIVALLAGPAFSLVSGVIGIVIDHRWTPFRERPFWRLLWLWTVFTSIQEGLGYLQVTALMPVGDTGQAFELLGLPPVAFVIATIIGWIGLPLTAWVFAAPIRELASNDRDRSALAVWPWLIGTAALLALMGLYVILSPVNDPGTVIAVLAGALAVGVFAPISMMFRSGAAATAPPTMTWPPRTGIAVLMILLIVNLILTRGWFWL